MGQMVIGALIFSAREWIVPAMLLVSGAIIFTFWGLLKGPKGGWLGTVSLILKGLGAAALGVCLLNPLWSGTRARPGANYVAVIADNSLGMNIKDAGETRSRGEMMKEKLVDEKSTWTAALGETFQVRRFRFDGQLQSVKDFSELAFDGRASAIRNTLDQIKERFRGQPLAGVLLLTDGIATDMKEGVGDLEGLPPIYPVVIGKPGAIKDIGIRGVSVTKSAFEDAPVTIQADVAAAGYGGSQLVAQLWESAITSTNKAGTGSKMVSEMAQRVAREDEPQAFRFQIRPEKPGISFYTVRVAAKNEQDQFNTPEKTTEATLLNNSAVAVVDRGKGPYRLLYVGGRPNWEFKFLNRALEEDEQLQLTALIRVAKREPKFAFRGRAGESSNPLFRGFDRKGDDTEKYDQPVLVRLNISDNNVDELKGGFPKTAEELYQFQAVILDDLEAEFFTHDQMVLLQKFVSERGGGVLMLGGPDSLREGKYDHTPIGEMLPVYLDSAPSIPVGENFKLELTREGWLQPWARLRKNETEEKMRLEGMPGFDTLNRVRGVKPGANVIATVVGEKGKQEPALVVQRFGRGHAATLMLGDLWRWGMKNETLHADLNKAWRQMMRWLIADVPNRIELGAEPAKKGAEDTVLLQVRARDKSFQPVDNANVTIQVRYVGNGNLGSTNNTIKIPAEPSGKEAGVYEASFVPRDAGGYVAEAIVLEPSGLELGRAEAGWTADPSAEEFRSLQPNRALLESLARKTGGEVLEMPDLDKFPARLSNKQAPIVESWSYPIWHQSSVLIFALACLAGEWGLRRYKGLA
jgi:uncharacterized membrane protein